MVGTFVSEMPPGESVQLIVDEGDEVGFGVGVAALHSGEQPRDFAG